RCLMFRRQRLKAFKNLVFYHNEMVVIGSMFWLHVLPYSSLALSSLSDVGVKNLSRSTGKPNGPRNSSNSSSVKYPNSTSKPLTNPKKRMAAMWESFPAISWRDLYVSSSSSADASLAYQVQLLSGVKNLTIACASSPKCSWL